jgi:hypothetical protein
VASFDRTRSGKPKTELWIPLNTRSKSQANKALPTAQVEASKRFEAAAMLDPIEEPLHQIARTI